MMLPRHRVTTSGGPLELLNSILTGEVGLGRMLTEATSGLPDRV
jgi:hypothetical protein